MRHSREQTEHMASIELEVLDREHDRHRDTKLDQNKLKKSQP